VIFLHCASERSAQVKLAESSSAPEIVMYRFIPAMVTENCRGAI
jgi:hypothetical protein